ncbi:plasmid replication protein, CyRepA1 family [Pleurocapsa sp. PCC 7319]|uniref:plasmid replication protein, CyRepA1 family n=1 Tax=Pleurocapsa sp. PCC 7319 TaxID=118161 RepID=UPI00034AE0E4|nr:plasmid replication protein, CyRepA1 family [Pleurocapsa sp. PCC 7319]
MAYPIEHSQHEDSQLDQIATHHLAEWRSSSVDDQLTTLNLLSLKGTEPKNHLFCHLPNSERRNDGRVRDKWLARYAHTEAGGWWVSGLNPHNGWQRWDWGRFKPDLPRIDREKNKPIKYESPPKGDSHVTYFDVPPHIWDKVAKRYGLKRYRSPLTLRLADKIPPKHSQCYSLTSTGQRQSLSDCLRNGVNASFLPQNLQSPPKPNPQSADPYCFWSWVQKHSEIPMILAEGEKKAACLLSLGFVAIALPGIWMGRGKGQQKNQLHPDLLPMVQPGRKFIILFDNDEQPSTRRAVHQATLLTGRAIEAAGASCQVASLPEGAEKGVDDFVTAKGKRAKSLITKIIKAALSLKDYLRKSRRNSWGLSSKYPPNVVVNTRYLSDAIRLPSSGLVALWSGMGTGKTELLARLRQEYPTERFLNIGHRVNLMKNLSERLSTQMYSEISQGQLAKAVSLSITVDSLYKLQTQFNEYGCVFIDEACQNLAHLLHSKTCKEHRAEILEVLEYIIGKAKLVVLADAHMNDVTLNFFRAMRPKGEVPFIIKNEYQQPGREVYFYEGQDSSALVAKVSTALMLGLKSMVVSDSKKFIKKLETTMTVQVDDQGCLFEPDELGNSVTNQLRIWSIHADNSGSEENKAFIKDISKEVKNVDALLASPSLGTGVDICDYHFDAVFGAFHAVSQSATECAQALHRYRHLVALHIWVAPRPPFGYQETNAHKIKQQMLDLNQMTAFLIRIDKENGTRGVEKDWALDAYCEIEAQRNYSINNLRDELMTLLEEMAYNITTVESESDAVVQTKLKEAGQYLDTAHQLAVVNAANISPQVYLARQAQEYLSPEEIVECEKYRLQRDYGMPVTAELVKRDGGGLLISQLIALESLLAPSSGEIIDPDTGRKYPAPPQIVADKDLRERDYLPLAMDWHNYSSKWLARHNLGLPKLLARLMAGEEICATDPDVVRMTQVAIASRVHVKAILNLTIPKNCQPLWLVGVLLNQLGLATASRKKGGRGQQITYRSLEVESIAFAVSVLQYREQQRLLKAEREREQQENVRQHQARMQSLYGSDPPKTTVSTPPNKENLLTLEDGVDTADDDLEMVNSDSDNTQDKLQPYLDLVLGTFDVGVSVLKEIVMGLQGQKNLLNSLLRWLSKPISFIPMDVP